ncbi:MAG: MFS transporter, partial [Thermoprotei archaeon]
MSSDEKRPGYRNVVALGFVSFFTDMSTEMILGILPVYLVEELGATKVILGLIEGLAELTNYIFRMVSGFISDRVGRRKPFVFAGYFLSGIAKPLFAYATTWLDALIVRIVDRMGKGVRTAPRDALISQSIRERDAGKAFGIHRTLDQLGAV